jgi:hypothetical protein
VGDRHLKIYDPRDNLLSSTNSTQADWVDVEHQPTDLAVGGSNPSRRAPIVQVGGLGPGGRDDGNEGLAC